MYDGWTLTVRTRRDNISINRGYNKPVAEEKWTETDKMIMCGGDVNTKN